ncbi:hypothetical protein VPHK165_0061 [Vibrio phage K165]
MYLPVVSSKFNTIINRAIIANSDQTLILDILCRKL